MCTYTVTVIAMTSTSLYFYIWNHPAYFKIPPMHIDNKICLQANCFGCSSSFLVLSYLPFIQCVFRIYFFLYIFSITLTHCCFSMFVAFYAVVRFFVSLLQMMCYICCNCSSLFQKSDIAFFVCAGIIECVHVYILSMTKYDMKAS